MPLGLVIATTASLDDTAARRTRYGATLMRRWAAVSIVHTWIESSFVATSSLPLCEKPSDDNGPLKSCRCWRFLSEAISSTEIESSLTCASRSSFGDQANKKRTSLLM